MKYFGNWAAPASLAILTSFFLAVHDAAYRVAFVQVTTMTLLITPKENLPSDKESENLKDKEEMSNIQISYLKSSSEDDSTPS